MEDEEQTYVWIRSQLDIDGKTYFTSLEVNDDHSIPLTQEAAMSHALAVSTAIEYACMDSIIFQQLREKMGNERHAAETVVEIRTTRPEIDFSATEPFRVRPSMNMSGKPYLTVCMNGEDIGQWEIPEAREHVLAILSAPVVANLDTHYHDYLRNTIGVDPGTADAAVEDLVRFR